MSRFFYSVPAKRHEALAVFDDLASIEHMPRGVTRDDFAAAIAKADFSATVYLGSRLDPIAGVAAVYKNAAPLDTPLDELAFTKTKALVDKYPISFARSIPNLLSDIYRAWGRPLAIHKPPSPRDAKWFIRCGCADMGDWLKYPKED